MASLGTKIVLALISGSAAAAAGLALVRACGATHETEGEAGGDAPTVEILDAHARLAEAFADRDARPVEDTLPHGIPRRRVPRRFAVNFFPSIGSGQVYDRDTISRRRPNTANRQGFSEHPNRGWIVRTNSLGFREDEEVSPEKPDVRVIVVGDSHVDGVCKNSESFPNVLERTLADEHPDRSIEILNGGTGGWSFYNYLGAIDAHAALKPDVFVFVVYGGNDFYEAIPLHHYNRREPLPRSNRGGISELVRLAREHRGLPSQWFNQVVFFRDHPGERAVAIQMAVDVSLELARRCDELGVALLAVYLPPFAHGQPARFASYDSLARERIQVSDRNLMIDEQLADAWLERIGARGVRTVDLRPAFRADPEPLYWETDHHINLAGQRRVAREVHDAIAELAGLSR